MAKVLVENQSIRHDRENHASTGSNRVAELGLERPPKLSHGLPAWLLSVMLHATMLVVLGFMVRVAHRGANLEPGRGGGIVLARDVDGAIAVFRRRRRFGQ